MTAVEICDPGIAYPCTSSFFAVRLNRQGEAVLVMRFFSRKRKKAELVQAFVDAAANFLIATILLALLFLTPVKQIASDLTQKILLGLSVPGGALGIATGNQRGRIGKWVFVDLGGRFCSKAAGGKSLCPPDLVRTNRKELAKVLKRVREAGPKVVVLDVATTPGDEHEDAALIEVLKSPGAPVILTWAPSPAGDEANEAFFVAHPGNFLCSLPKCEELPFARYLPAVAKRVDGAARSLGPDYVIAPDSDAGGAWRTPGAALGAALVAGARGDAPWSRLDAFGTGKQPSRPPDQAECILSDLEACAEAYRQTERVFSFEPVKPGTAIPSPPGDGMFLHLLPGVSPSGFTDLTGAVVVIGDSRQEAGDRWWSAAGDVGGAEIILNDARQFTLAPPRPAAGLVGYLIAELPFLFAGLVVAFGANLLLPAHPPEAGHAQANAVTALRGAARAGLRLGFIVTGTALLFAALLMFRREEIGAPPDLLTPFVGIIIESCFEALHNLANALHLAGQALVKRIFPPPSPGGSN